MQEITVHGRSLEGNLDNNPADRQVSVYLPPSYSRDLKRRYPVVYFLHGFSDTNAKWFGAEPKWVNLRNLLDRTIANGTVKEMIAVVPNAYTRFQGSFYSNSIVTGNWEDFITNDLVRYIDAHYRTLSSTESRGLAGHSMGGYGTIRIGMKHPEGFRQYLRHERLLPHLGRRLSADRGRQPEDRRDPHGSRAGTS